LREALASKRSFSSYLRIISALIVISEVRC
jgi:hypothetical protein